MLVSGKVKLSLVSSQGIDKPLDFVAPGGSFGDITMLLERPYYLTAQALEDSLLLYPPRNAIVQLIENDSRFAMRMLASLSMRMRNVVDDIESFSLQPPAARLVTYLLRLLPPGSMTPAKIELSIHKNVVAAQSTSRRRPCRDTFANWPTAGWSAWSGARSWSTPSTGSATMWPTGRLSLASPAGQEPASPTAGSPAPTAPAAPASRGPTGPSRARR